MSKNSLKIRERIKAMAHRPYEIISGAIVNGSVDTTAFTATVQPADDSAPIKGVKLNAVAGNGNGMVLFPADGSDVVIASIDGPGEWILVRAATITKALVTTGGATWAMDNTAITLTNNDVVLQVGDSVFKINTAGESLYGLLHDLLSSIMALTVPTPAGTSSVPVNLADFNTLLTRLDNLLVS